MKILFLNLYSGKIERGAETFAHELAEQLGQKHEIVFIKGNSDKVSSHQFNGNLWQRWFNRKRWFINEAGLAILRFTWSQLSLVRKEKPDWVIPMNGFWQLLLLKVLQPFVGYNILVTGHSGPGWDERWNLYLKPDVFIATTGPTLDWAHQTCLWTTVKLIPYGTAPGRFDPGSEELWDNDLRVKLREPVYLCPSALVPYKRIDVAIKAVAELENGSLLVLGKGPLEKELKKLGTELLGKRFKLMSVAYEQMPAMYALADVITLPSKPQENSPMVFVEALAAGKPVVATDAPRVRWALEDAGFYVDPENIEEYANALDKASKSKVDTTKPLKKFLWPNVLRKYEALLGE